MGIRETAFPGERPSLSLSVSRQSCATGTHVESCRHRRRIAGSIRLSLFSLCLSAVATCISCMFEEREKRGGGAKSAILDMTLISTFI